MREAVVVASSRTPLAKSFRGSFNLTRPDDLAAHCITDVLRKVPQLDPAEIEDVILGCGAAGGPAGEQRRPRRGDPGRAAGDRRRHDRQPLLLVGPAGHRHGGAPDHARRRRRGHRRRRREHHGDASVKRDPNPWVQEHKPGIYMVMGDTAEVVAKRYKIGREAQDEYACSSQQRTAAAQQEGFFKEELAPMQRRPRHPRQEDRRRSSARRSTPSTRTSATAPTRRSRGCRAQAVLRPEERPGHGDGRQLVAALRRRLGHAADVAAARRGAGHQAAGGLPRLRRRRLRAGRDGHRPGVRRAEAAQAARPEGRATSTCGS